MIEGWESDGWQVRLNTQSEAIDISDDQYRVSFTIQQAKEMVIALRAALDDAEAYSGVALRKRVQELRMSPRRHDQE